MTAGLDGLSPVWVGRFSIWRTTDLPLRTSPKTTCLLSRWGVWTVVMKNWEPLVSEEVWEKSSQQMFMEQNSTQAQ